VDKTNIKAIIDNGFPIDKMEVFFSFLDSLESEIPSLGRKIKQNILAEHFLSVTSTIEIIEFVCSNFSKPTKVLFEDLKSIIVNFRLHGENIKIKYPSFVGTIISYDNFLNNLMNVEENKRILQTNDDINRFVKSLFNYNYIQGPMKRLLLKRDSNLVWLTFDLEDDIPFSYIKNNLPEEYLISLGLKDNRFGKDDPLIALVFNSSLHLDGKIYRPTICDSMFYHYWKPTENENRFGESDPIDNGKFYHNFEITTYSKRPEAVILSSEIPLGLLVKVSKISHFD
jgi:hypothetical protein